MRREEEVLLACAAARFTGTAERVRAAVRGPVDWLYLGDTAARHGILPLAYRAVLETCHDLVPEPILAGWRERYTRNARRNLFLAGELLRLLALFESQGIRAVPYKGPTLAQLAYGDLTLRDFSDNDLMIHREDLPPARALLLAEGYRPELTLTPAQEAAYIRSRHSLVFMDARGSIVEIHWAIQPRYFAFDMDPGALWGRLRPIGLAGRTVMTYSREDLLLILCLHGAKHMWSRLEWICDLAGVLGAGELLDWDRVLGESRRLGARRVLLLGLDLARTLVYVEVPPEISKAILKDPAVPPLAGRVRRWLFATANQPAVLESTAFFAQSRERLRDKARYCLRLATTPYVRDWALVPLPGAMSPFYYLIRPFRILGRYAAGTFRRE